MSRDEAYSKSKEALKKAFALDSENGEAYAVRADLKSIYENDLAGTELDYERALQISPWSPLVLTAHSVFLYRKGRLEEALSGMRLLVEIDPQDPQNHAFVGGALYFLRRYDDSIIAYNKAVELDPNFLNANCMWTVFCLLARGENDKALEMAKRLAPIDRWYSIYLSGVIEAVKGNKADAEKYIESLTPSIETVPWAAAVLFAAMGNRDKALQNLTRVYNENRSTLFSAFLTQFFDKYRADPEFVDLLKKSGFEFR